MRIIKLENIFGFKGQVKKLRNKKIIKLRSRVTDLESKISIFSKFSRTIFYWQIWDIFEYLSISLSPKSFGKKTKKYISKYKILFFEFWH